MADFKRLAEIDVRANVDSAMRELTRLTNHQKRLLEQELILLEKKRKKGGMSEKESLTVRKRIAAIKAKFGKDEYAQNVKILKDTERAEADHARKIAALNKTLRRAIAADDKRAHLEKVQRLQTYISVKDGMEKVAAKRHAERVRYEELENLQRLQMGLKVREGMEKAAAERRRAIFRHIENLERQHARRMESIHHRKNARIAASDRNRGMGLSPVGGIGPGGGFGYLIGGGAAGAAMIGGMAMYQKGQEATRTFLDQQLAVARVMSLVSDAEQEAGFTFKFATREAQQLAIAMGMTIPEAAQAMREAITTDVAPILAGTFVKSAHGLAILEGVNVGEVTGALASVRNAYEMTAQQMAELPDIIFTSIDEGNLKLQQIRGQLGDVAGVMNTAGVNFRELMAAASALTRGGMAPARAMTSLRAFGEILQKPATRRVQNARDAAGLDLTAEHMRAVGFLKVLDEIREASDKTGHTIAELLGGRARALKGIIQLTGTLRDDVEEIMQKQTENMGRAAKEHERLMETAPMRLKRAQAAVEKGMADVGQNLVEVFAAVLGKGDRLEENLKSITDTMGAIGHVTGDVVMGFSRMVWLANKLNPIANLQLRALSKIIDLLNIEATEAERIAEIKAEDLRVIEEFIQAQEERNRLEEQYARQMDAINERMEGRKQEMFKEEVDASSNMVKEFKADFNERLSHLKRVQGEELSAAKSHADALRDIEKKRVDFMIAQTQRLENERMDATGANDLERAFRAKRRFDQFKALAVRAAGQGDRESASKFNQQASTIAGTFRGLKLDNVQRFGTDFDAAVSGLANQEIARLLQDQQAQDVAEGRQPRRRVNSLDRFKAIERARNNLRVFVKSLQDQKRAFSGESGMSFEQTLSENMLRETNAQGLGIFEMSANRERAAGQQHLEVYQQVTVELRKANEIWQEIRIAAEAAANAAKLMAGSEVDDPLGARAAMLRQRESLAHRVQNFVGSIGDRFRRPDGPTPGAIDETRSTLYNRPIEVNLTFNGPVDPKKVREATAAGLRDGLDRGTTNIDPNK